MGQQLATPAPLTHSLPGQLSAKLHSSTKTHYVLITADQYKNSKRQPLSLNSNQHPPFNSLGYFREIIQGSDRFDLADYALTIFARVSIWSEVERLLETSSRLLSFSSRASLVLQLPSATLFCPKPERSSSSPHSLFTVDTIRRCCGVMLNFTWYHDNALATTAPRKCHKWWLNILITRTTSNFTLQLQCRSAMHAMR